MANRELQFGLVTPQEGKTCEQILSSARLVEELGFDSVHLYDHLYMSSGAPYPECWTMLSAIAAGTSRIKFGPLVLNNLFRHPALVAKMGAALDQISQGRLKLGIGAGWNKDECVAYGIEFPEYKQRVAMLAEAIEIIQKLWKARGQPVSFQGKYYAVKEAVCMPPPHSEPTPPIFVGGASNEILRVVAKYSIGLNVDQDWNVGLARLQRTFTALDQTCQLEGTDPKNKPRSLCVRLFVGASEEEAAAQQAKFMTASTPATLRVYLHRAMEKARKSTRTHGPIIRGQTAVLGTPEDCVSQLREYHALGVTEFLFKVYDFTDSDLLKVVADQIVKPMREQN